MALKERIGKTGGWKGGPNRREQETLSEKTRAPTVRRRDIGKMSALTKKKRKKKE
jgi:hypothetical protein